MHMEANLKICPLENELAKQKSCVNSEVGNTDLLRVKILQYKKYFTIFILENFLLHPSAMNKSNWFLPCQPRHHDLSHLNAKLPQKKKIRLNVE